MKKLIAAGAVVLAAGVVAGYVSLGPVPGSAGGSGDDVESLPTATPLSDDGTANDATDVGMPFTFTVDHVERCGETCRDVTTTLTNEQSTAASDVSVYTRVYAGRGTDGTVVWEGTEPVGGLDAGESYTTAERVKLSLGDAYAVKRAGGWITVETTVTSGGETMTFTRRRDVA